MVCDGAVRDVASLAGLADFAVFARHITPRGPTAAERGAVNLPAVVGGRLITPGDLLIGDDDGLVCLTPDILRTRLEAAQAKVAKEAEWVAGLEAGKAVAALFNLPPAMRG